MTKSGRENGITEGTTRARSFVTAFATVPHVELTIADALNRTVHLEAQSVTVNGFTISVIKVAGGAAQARDVYWVATDAGNP